MEQIKKKINWTSLFYAFKFILFAAIASYDYSIQSKLTLGWMMIAMFELALFIIQEIKS